MLDSDLEVFSLGAEIDPGELRTEFVIEPQLGISFQRLLDGRYHNLKVVFSRHPSLGDDSDHIAGKDRVRGEL